MRRDAMQRERRLERAPARGRAPDTRLPVAGEAPRHASTIDDWSAALSASPETLDAFDRAIGGLRAQVEAALGGPPVQLKAAGVAGAGDPQAVARTGLRGAGGALPFRDRIQAAFGRHDVSHVRSFGDSAAVSAGRQLGAHAFASGDSVAFARAPDLHTAAHEAAHVVQQRAGVSLSGGVGARGDVYERHADQVADAVVRGQDVEGLLARAPSGSGRGGVQRVEAEGASSEPTVGGAASSGRRVADTVARLQAVHGALARGALPEAQRIVSEVLGWLDVVAAPERIEQFFGVSAGGRTTALVLRMTIGDLRSIDMNLRAGVRPRGVLTSVERTLAAPHVRAMLETLNGEAASTDVGAQMKQADTATRWAGAVILGAAAGVVAIEAAIAYIGPAYLLATITAAANDAAVVALGEIAVGTIISIGAGGGFVAWIRSLATGRGALEALQLTLEIIVAARSGGGAGAGPRRVRVRGRVAGQRDDGVDLRVESVPGHEVESLKLGKGSARPSGPETPAPAEAAPPATARAALVPSRRLQEIRSLPRANVLALVRRVTGEGGELVFWEGVGPNEIVQGVRAGPIAADRLGVPEGTVIGYKVTVKGPTGKAVGDAMNIETRAAPYPDPFAADGGPPPATSAGQNIKKVPAGSAPANSAKPLPAKPKLGQVSVDKQLEHTAFCDPVFEGNDNKRADRLTREAEPNWRKNETQDEWNARKQAGKVKPVDPERPEFHTSVLNQKYATAAMRDVVKRAVQAKIDAGEWEIHDGREFRIQVDMGEHVGWANRVETTVLTVIVKGNGAWHFFPTQPQAQRSGAGPHE